MLQVVKASCASGQPSWSHSTTVPSPAWVRRKVTVVPAAAPGPSTHCQRADEAGLISVNRQRNGRRPVKWNVASCPCRRISQSSTPGKLRQLIDPFLVAVTGQQTRLLERLDVFR